MLDRAQVRDLYLEVSELPESDRAGLLDQRCAGNAELRAEVQSLLAAAARRPEFLAAPTAPAMPCAAAEAPGVRIGPYKLLQEIGQGGFGSVYMAQQEHPVWRRVAIKVIKLGMDTRSVIARFEAERQALAMMDHANIARVFDAGATESGRPYFVMELVRGEAITAYCDRNQLSIPERLDLFLQVCRAVQHAHSKGVIHRDIKPGNILVATEDGRPHAKVIDFGIAKATERPLTDKTAFTDFRQFVGTPEYMSPEQAEGSLNIDTRSDVYSLGVLLYELLTGATPFDARALRSAAYDEIQRIIREVDPERPSTRLSRSASLDLVATRRHTEPRRLSALVRGDLDWIVMRAIDKERARRYDTASALAADVARHLAAQPVEAVPPSLTYAARKFVRRYRVLVAGGSVILATLLLGIAGTTWGLVSARAAERHSSDERDSATAVRDFLARTFEGVSPQVALGRDTALVGNLMDKAAARINAGELNAIPNAERELRVVIAGVYADVARYQDAAQVLRPLRDAPRSALPGPLARRLDLLSGRIGLATGAWDEAKKALDSVLAESPDDRARAESLSMLGEIAINASQFDLSIDLHRRAVDSARAVAPHDDQLLATCLSRLGAAQAFCGKDEDAARTIEQLMAIVSRPEWSSSPLLVESLNAKSMLLTNTRPQDAVREMRSVVQTARRIFPSPHPMIALSLHNLGAALYFTREFEEALKPAEEALEMRRSLFGADAPETIESVVETGSMLVRLGRHEDAMARIRAAIAAYAKRSPGGSYDEAHERMMLAESLRSLKRLDEAVDEYARAVEGLKTYAAPDDPKVSGCIRQYALCLREAGKPALSAEAWRDLIRLSRVGDAHPDQLAAAQFMLADVLLDIDTPQARIEAQTALRDCLDTRRRSLPDGHPDVLARHYTMCLLGSAIVRGVVAESADAAARLACIREAEPLLLAGYQGIVATQKTPGNPDRARRAVQDLIMLYGVWDSLEPGAGHADQAAHWRSVSGEPTPATAQSH
ncbi:MAG: protein kinase [Planctomycetes bacterium]|nr:protein kinase [Planctomycetota bacterium]